MLQNSAYSSLFAEKMKGIAIGISGISEITHISKRNNNHNVALLQLHQAYVYVRTRFI